MRRFLHELFSVGSRLLNVITGGTADWTFSGRVHRDGIGWAERLVDAVFVWRESDHCGIWYRGEIERSRRNAAKHDAGITPKSKK